MADLIGSIRLFKRLRKHPVWERSDYGYCWVDLLLLANDQERVTFVQSERIPLKRGQLCWSLRSLEKEWKKSGEWVTRFLQFLVDENMVTVDSNRRRTIITILNYETYNAPEPGSETVTEPGSETVTEPEQKGEMGKGNRKGERASAAPHEPFPEIPDDETVQCFCASHRDAARGCTAGIPEVWWRGWLASRLASRAPFPTAWKRALVSAFTADLISRHPKALGKSAASARLDGQGAENKKNAPVLADGHLPDGRSVRQARFEMSKELEAVQARLDAAYELGERPDAGDKRRERELKEALKAL